MGVQSGNVIIVRGGSGVASHHNPPPVLTPPCFSSCQVLSSVLCWSPSPAPSARQSMLSLMAQSDSTAHSPSRRPTLTRKRAKSLHHPSAVDVATSVLREWQQGKLITAKINAVLYVALPFFPNQLPHPSVFS